MNLLSKIIYKFSFKLILFSLLIGRLLGFNSFLEILTNTSNLKLFTLTLTSLIIIYFFINLYLLHKFYRKNVKIPDILPNFLLSWLKEFAVLSSSDAGFKETKNHYYLNIFIYVFILIFILL